MQKSLYFEQVDKYFPSLVLEIIEKFNEKNSEAQAFPYLFRERLRPQYSADGRWASITANYTNVAADVVALDTTLPLKSRDSIEQVTGEIPKLGMKLSLKEKDMKDIENMSAQLAAGNEAMKNILIQRIFEDTPKVIRGVYERIEDIFLSELSTGVGLATQSNGLGIRLDVGYKAKNQKGVSTDWSNAETATPIDDMQKVFDEAILVDGNYITDLWLDDDVLANLKKNKQVRQSFAFIMNFAGQGIPNLTTEQVQTVFMNQWGVTIHRVARRILTETNGKRNYENPWAKGVIVFTCDQYLGSLVWTTCAEATRPVEGVAYQTADNFLLVSKYSKNEPLTEFTASQAMVVPVVNNVDRIYTLNSHKVVA